jgi:hypothetical protein
MLMTNILQTPTSKNWLTSSQYKLSISEGKRLSKTPLPKHSSNIPPHPRQPNQLQIPNSIVVTPTPGSAKYAIAQSCLLKQA